jgi:DNA-binding MarR family transcriptional regulator
VNLEGNLSVAGFGLGGTRTPNESTGFDAHGFFEVVDRLLRAAFTAEGGIICVLDNLEILNTSQLARQRLEALRDDLFAKHGLKWVVCGARGIVRSVASSARLQGRLQEPIEVQPLTGHSIDELIASRVAEFKIKPNSIPPVGAEAFKHVFSILNDNLRDALKYSGDFSAWLDYNQQYTENETELEKLFEIWLADQSDRYFSALNVPPRAWRLFDEICNRGGSISPSDYEDFGFTSSQNMRGQVAKLEQADLVVSELEDSDHRRKTISVQAKGWLLQHHRSGYKVPNKNRN